MAAHNPLPPLQIPPRPPPPLAPPALNLIPPQPPGHQPPVRPPVPQPPPDPDSEGNIGVLLDPNWFHVIILKCTENIHEGTASVTLDCWQRSWSFLPNEFVESALQASSGLKIQHLIVKHHLLTQLPANFSAPQTGLPISLSTLDLSHNQFSALPLVVCDLTALKFLHLNNNVISHLPSQISNLTKLEALCLQANQLQTLPVCVCSLTSLRHLNAEDNAIRTVPSEICQLQQLKALHLMSNKITRLPQNLAKLPNLEELHLGNNLLKHFVLDSFKALRQLHLANNNLHTLPFSVVRMDLQGLTVSNNPLTFPPLSVCRRGLDSIKSYMLEKYNTCTDANECVVDNPYYESGDEDTDYEDVDH